MKISEALRKGALGHTQVRGEFVSKDGIGRCALGAVAMASDIPLCFESLQKLYPVLAVGADTEYGTGTLYRAIIRMNDDEHKTFEEIAQWLESQGL